MDAQRLLLDELMGKNRNANPGEGKELHWDDEEVCKFYLCGFCPSELFTNTKNDLGPCDKVHEERLRTEYEGSRRFKSMGYESEFVRHLEGLVGKLDRKIVQGLQRLKDQDMLAGATGDAKEEIEAIAARIEVLTNQINTLGEEGRVDEAQTLMAQVDKLRQDQQKLAGADGPGTDKAMELCRICGAFLQVGDAQSRVDAHLQGKTHLGYAQIRKAIADYHNERGRGTGANSRSQSRDPERRDSDRGRDRRDSTRDRERERERDRDRDRERDRDRDRGRDRDRDRERERDRDRGRDRDYRR